MGVMVSVIVESIENKHYSDWMLADGIAISG
jgi:hypothetical protein